MAALNSCNRLCVTRGPCNILSEFHGAEGGDLPPWNVPIFKVRIWDTSKGDSMSRKRYTAEQIIGPLRQAEIRTSEGKTIAEAVRELGISEQTYYRWRKQYGGMEVIRLGASRSCSKKTDD